MTARELVDGLRELADLLEQHGEQFDGVRFNAGVWAHCDEHRDAVIALVRLMGSPQADRGGGHHWINGRVGGIDLSAHYSPGLLGATRREEVRTIIVEETPDIAALIAEEVPHAV